MLKVTKNLDVRLELTCYSIRSLYMQKVVEREGVITFKGQIPASDDGLQNFVIYAQD